MKLSKLAKLEKEEIENEKKDIENEIISVIIKLVIRECDYYI